MAVPIRVVWRFYGSDRSKEGGEWCSDERRPKVRLIKGDVVFRGVIFFSLAGFSYPVAVPIWFPYIWWAMVVG